MAGILIVVTEFLVGLIVLHGVREARLVFVKGCTKNPAALHIENSANMLHKRPLSLTSTPNPPL